MKTFANNIKKEVISVVDFFLSFLTTYDERRSQNMLALMLDIRFNVLRLIYSFIGREHGVAIVGTIKKHLFPMLLKSYRYLHPLFEVESFFVHKINEDSSLDIFEMVANTSELTKELVNQNLLIFHKYRVDKKISNGY